MRKHNTAPHDDISSTKLNKYIHTLVVETSMCRDPPTENPYIMCGFFLPCGGFRRPETPYMGGGSCHLAPLTYICSHGFK